MKHENHKEAFPHVTLGWFEIRGISELLTYKYMIDMFQRSFMDKGLCIEVKTEIIVFDPTAKTEEVRNE